uniref:Iron-binding zinc finger CDGSH type domain-containing protein n=1 Tax=Urocitellus parryii TaxID=9999 RepID=A0A8D2GQJ1_UROPR
TSMRNSDLIKILWEKSRKGAIPPYKTFYVKDCPNKLMVNLYIQKDNSEIVHAFEIPSKELGDKIVYCHCWKSKNFSFCDGSHTKHEETGDNMEPLIVNKKET